MQIKNICADAQSHPKERNVCSKEQKVPNHQQLPVTLYSYLQFI